MADASNEKRWGTLWRETPLAEVEAALVALRDGISSLTLRHGRASLQIDGPYQRNRNAIVALIGHLTVAAPLVKEIRRLEGGEWASTKLSRNREVIGSSIDDCLKQINKLKRVGGTSRPLLTKDEFLLQLKIFQRVCLNVISDAPEGSQRREYSKLRRQLVSANPYFVPLSPTLSPDCDKLKRDVRRAHPAHITFLNGEFEQAIRNLTSSPRHGATSVAASAWTGERSVKQQVVTIRTFAPVVLGSLNELIELHHRLVHNQTPEPSHLEAVALLKLLHSDIGDLLTAVNGGKPFKSLANKVRKLGERLFSISRDTRELLIAGVPTMGATGITLGVVKGLELISGFNLAETETAAIITVAGGAYAMQDVARRKGSTSRSKE